MIKSLLTFLFLAVLGSNAISQELPEYSNWLFVQSDKALQYRMAVVKQEGNIASLQLQFRVNNEDEVFCKSALCNGMLMVLSNRNVGDEMSTKYNFVFEKSFVGLDNVYTWPTMITTELKTWPDGSKRFFNPARGIVYTLSGSDIERHASVPDACVDVILAANPNEHRCRRDGFDYSGATVVK